MKVDLRAARLNRGLSLRDAANEMGVKEPVLRRAESGGGVHPGNAFKIARFYGYQVTEVWPIEPGSPAAGAAA